MSFLNGTNLRLFTLPCASVNTHPFGAFGYSPFHLHYTQTRAGTPPPTCAAGRAAHPTTPAAITGPASRILCKRELINKEPRASRWEDLLGHHQARDVLSKHISLERDQREKRCQKLTFSPLGGRESSGDTEAPVETGRSPPREESRTFFSGERKSTPISLCSISHESVMICPVDKGF